MSNYLPDDDATLNQKKYLLDPLSVIIKLAILASKPVGTKVCIQNNVMSFQDPGPFQGLCRIIYKLNKTDLHFMYNPIHLACLHYLSAAALKSRPRMRNLFVYAQRGIERLIETYQANSTVVHRLNYYHAIIAVTLSGIENMSPPPPPPPPHTETKETKDTKRDVALVQVDVRQYPSLFRKDSMSVLYGEELVSMLNNQWTDKWITAILDIIGFLSDNSISSENIRVLESLMMTIDSQTQGAFTFGGQKYNKPNTIAE